MKRILLCLASFAFSVTARAQVPKVDWVKSIGGTGNDRGNCVTADNKGNIIIAGRFHSSALVLPVGTLTNSDTANANVFLIKLSPDGKILWAIGAGEKRDDHITKCATDSKGNIVAVGWFESQKMTFGDITLTNSNPEGKGCDFFIAKFSGNGKCLWAKNAGGEGSSGDYGACAVDKNDNIIVSGLFNKMIDFEGTKFVTEKVSGYVAKYSSSGKLLWAKSAIGNAQVQSSSCDKNGNVFLGGFFFSPTLLVDNLTLTKSGAGGNTFVAKFSPDGKLAWAKNIEGNGNCYAEPSGSVYVYGNYFTPELKIGKYVLTSTAESAVFISKFDANGEVLWAKGVAGEGPVRYGYSDKKGNLYVTGSSFGAAYTFDKYQVVNTAKSESVFIGCLAPGGEVLWANGASGKGRNAGRGITVDNSGNTYLIGSFEDPALKFDEKVLSNAGGADVYLVKYSNKQ